MRTYSTDDREDDAVEDANEQRLRAEVIRRVDSFMASRHSVLTIKRDGNTLLFEETRKVRISL